jgi:hypothetical protein
MSQATRIIQIIVSPTGQTTVQTKGFAGSSCRDATKALEAALGIVQADQPTAEMYQSGLAAQQVHQSGG